MRSQLRLGTDGFSSQQTTEVYHQIYSTLGVRRLASVHKRLGIVSSLLLSLVVVGLSAWALTFVESALGNFSLSAATRAVLGVQTAHAADPKLTIREGAYSARFLSQSEADPVTIEAGSSKLIRINFRNTGTAAWNNEGTHYISAYTMEPRGRDSVFFGPGGWKSPRQIGRMVGFIAPGEVGEFGVPLYAPEQPGEYIEEFHLASENNTWVQGGYFFLKIHVVPSSSDSTVTNAMPEVQNTDQSEETETYEAKQLFLSKKQVSAAGGEKMKLLMAYQNLGTATWKDFQVSAGAPTALAAVTQLSFADESWHTGSVVAQGPEEIAPFQTLRKTVYFRTPRTAGEYRADFTIAADGHVIGTASIPVTVTSDAPQHYQEPDFQEVAPIVVPRIATEPRIRVGLWRPEGEAQVVSYEADYNVFAGSELKGILPKKKIGHLEYANGIYGFSGGGLTFESDTYLRLSPIGDEHAVFQIRNWTREVSWKGPGNFNTYRGAIELRVGERNPDVWLVLDTPFERGYMHGVAENSNGSDFEYLKAQTVAQRSYAYSIQQSDKYGIFDVVATTGDQLFLGYNSEQMMPNFVRAATETRGYMATYDVDGDGSTPNEAVITPYYAHSDGRTRSWQEVWGGSSKPWLVSVRAQYDAGRGMLGHGVGMSQLDAVARAKSGVLWQDLVQYYYTGVEVERMYN